MSAPLQGVRVLDLGQYVAGPLLSMLLAEQGAEVIRVDPPGGPRWETQLNRVLLRGRARTLRLDLHSPEGQAEARALVGASDVVVENFRPGVLARLGLDPEDLMERHPGVVLCSLPGFGSRDPRAHMAGWEGVVLAAAGCYATGSREMLDGEWWPSSGPAFTPLLLGSVFAGALGAVGVAAALLARERDGLGQHVEVPLYDALFEAMGARVLRYERGTPPGFLLGSGFYRCADERYVSLVTVWHRHLEWFLRAAGRESWLTEGFATYRALMADADAREELRDRLVDLFADRPASEWECLGQQAGVPLAAVRTATEWQRAAPTLAPDSVREDANGAWPGPVIRIREHPPVTTEPHVQDASGDVCAKGPLVGIRIVDMTRVLAAPTITRLLAELGAEVTKVDVAPGTTEAGLREPFFHESVNRGKRLVELDAHTEAGAQKIKEMCADADALVTNFTRPVLSSLGVDTETLGRAEPHIVHTYVNAFGTSGPWADLRGYAEIANAVTGITARTLGAGPPSGVAPNVDLPRAPTTDYAAGILGAYAVLLGLLRRTRTGRGCAVETSLVDAACLEQIYQLHGSDDPAEIADALGWGDLQRLYQVSDGWVFLGAPESARDRVAELMVAATPDAGGLSAALAGLTADEAVSRATAAGAAAHTLVAMDELLDREGLPDQLGLRLEHHSLIFGSVVQPGPVIRLSRTPMRAGELPDPVGLDPIGRSAHSDDKKDPR